jgi:low temperature requirement protein LtrA
MAKRQIWQIPYLHREEDENRERRVTWLELFFDLMFVILISQLSLKLYGNVNLNTIFEFVITFLPVWWVWIGTTFYNERFETQGLENRFFYLILMFPILGMSLFSKESTSSTSAYYALFYSLARTFIIILWGRATYHVREFRKVGIIYVTGFSVSIILFILSIFITPPERFYVWAFAIFLEFLTPFLTLNKQKHLPKLSTSKRPERFGLLIIIALGELIVNITSGLKLVKEYDLNVVLLVFASVFLSFLLWATYFDFIGRRVPKASMFVGITWTHLHLPFVMSIVGLGASFYNAIANTNNAPLGSKEVLIGSVILSLTVLGLLERTLERTNNEPTHPNLSWMLKVGTALSLGILFPYLCEFSYLHILFIGVIAFLIQTLYAIYVWFTQELDIEQEEEDEELESI